MSDTHYTRSGGSPPQQRRRPVQRAFTGMHGGVAPAVITEAKPGVDTAAIGRRAEEIEDALLAEQDEKIIKPALTRAQRALRRKAKIAENAAKWRAKQNAQFKEREAERQRKHRAEAVRGKQIEAVLDQNPEGVMTVETPNGRARVETGRYGRDTVAQAGSGLGHGPDVDMILSKDETEDEFVDVAFYRAELRIVTMRNRFARKNTRLNVDTGLFECVVCKKAFGSKRAPKKILPHFEAEHPDAYRKLLVEIYGTRKKQDKLIGTYTGIRDGQEVTVHVYAARRRGRF